MLTPRYIFSGEYERLYSYFLTQPHRKKILQKGEYLWKLGQPREKIYYICSGIAVHYADHENGRRKIISFHGTGTVFPGYHRNVYKIELSLVTQALSEMQVLEFTVAQFETMFEQNVELSKQVVDWYSMYINRFLFETIHQEYNPLLVKISNLLYLLTTHTSDASQWVIDMTQEELAEILGVSRVQLTRGLADLRKRGIISTTRGKLFISDRTALERLCSSETF